jgi:glutamate-1-semialdehyde aminotransferase
MRLLARGRRVVPGASQTISKAPHMFVEGAYPVFLEEGTGCRVRDIDGNEYIDYILGLGAITLGYNYAAVTEAVTEQLGRGTIFSLPSPLEVEVAERLVELVPCAEMARFFKTGSEANAAAVRIARAATGREKIIYCGYHGWHDWYAVTTSLARGIPACLQALVIPFAFNDLDSLAEAFRAHRGEVAAVIMEPVLIEPPAPGFLADVKALAHEHGAALIFDEIVSGFRWAVGGAQEYFGVTPDLATFGKGMANGLPLAALVGSAELMGEFDRVFVSSTFGGDAAALAACLATVAEYRGRPVIDHLWGAGTRFRDGFRSLCRALAVEADCLGYPVHPKIVFSPPDPGLAAALMSLFLQEAAKGGVLFHFGGFNISFSHGPADIDQTLQACEAALGVVRDAVRDGRILERLEGKPHQEVFRRS